MEKRNYGIDLLRLVLMYMVCILHTLGKGGILDNCLPGSAQEKVYWFLESASYCAVDGFALISGYIASNRARKYEKIVEMWFQAFFYSFVLTMVLTFAGVGANLRIIEILKCAMPVTFNKFWYFTAYFALFFAIPVLNSFLFSIDETTARKALLIIAVLFSAMGVLADPFRTKWGYSTLWLMAMYCVGVLLRRVRLFQNRNTWTLIVLWIVCVGATWLVRIAMGINRLANYVSPTVLLSGIIMVVLFSRLKFKSRWVSKLSSLAFGVYLFQLNQVIWNILIGEAFADVVHLPVTIGTIKVFSIATAIFAAGLTAEFIRSRIADVLRIPLLSKKIVVLANWIMGKLLVFLQ